MRSRLSVCMSSLTSMSRHELINKHVKAVSERIAELQLLRENLLDLSARCNGHHSSGHCGIMESLEAYSQEGGCCSEFMNIKHSK